MQSVKQESCAYQIFDSMVWLDQELFPNVVIQKQTLASLWHLSGRQGYSVDKLVVQYKHGAFLWNTLHKIQKKISPDAIS